MPSMFWVEFFGGNYEQHFKLTNMYNIKKKCLANQCIRTYLIFLVDECLGSFYKCLTVYEWIALSLRIKELLLYTVYL